MRITFTDPLSNDPVALTKTAEFYVTIVHTCDTNPFTLTEQPNLSYTVPAGTTDANSPTVTIAKTTVNNANADSNCWLSYRTEYWDPATNEWNLMTATSANASPRSTFILANSYSDAVGAGGATHFTTNEFKLFLPHSQLAAFVTAYSNLTPKFRTKVYDVASRTVYDEFEIVFTYACWNDAVSLNTISDQTYTFGQGALSLNAPVLTHTYADCPYTYSVFVLLSGFGVGDLWKQHGSCAGCLDFLISNFNVNTGVV